MGEGREHKSTPDWREFIIHQCRNLPWLHRKATWKHATYRWASHTWSLQATTNHRACCTRSAWTPQERCSQEYLLWRRPETRATRQGGPAGGRVPRVLVYRPKATSTTWSYPRAKHTGRPSCFMANLICRSPSQARNNAQQGGEGPTGTCRGD